MAAFQKESGTAKGRGFGTVDGVPSFLNRFVTWITKTPGAGGPNWYIIDNQSALPTNPYIVISDVAAPTNANKGKVIQVILPTATADTVLFYNWMWWNVTTHVGVQNYQRYAVNTNETVEYEYNFRGGPECLLIMTRVLGAWDWVLIDEWAGNANLVEVPTVEATLTQRYALAGETGDNNNQVAGYDGLTGIGPNLDVNGKLYFSVTVSGANSQIFIYKDSARTQLIGQTTNGSTPGFTTVTGQNSSGLAGQIERTAVVATDTDIEVDFALYVGAGQGAQFTVGRYYYAWEFENGFSSAAYFKVLAVVGDRIIADGINNIGLRTGTVISPYGHRWLVFGNTGGSDVSAVTGSPQIPYMSFYSSQPGSTQSSSNALSDGVNSFTQVGWEAVGALLTTMDPDDEQSYLVVKPLVYETGSRSGFSYHNRAYGQQKNIFNSSSFGMTQMNDGKTIDGVNYICFHITGNSAYLVRDTTSLS